MRVHISQVFMAMVVVFGVAVFPQSSAAATSYPLVCLAGGNYLFSLNVNEQSTTATIRFERGSAGAGQNLENLGALKPGECAWLDRAVSADEPNVILHTVTEKPFLGFEWTPQGSDVEQHHLRLGQVRISLSSELVKNHPYLAALVEAQPGQHSFSVFQVYNNRQGYLVVTRLGL